LGDYAFNTAGIEGDSVSMAEAAHEKRTKTPTIFLVTVEMMQST
jgi:hypothetical protein